MFSLHFELDFKDRFAHNLYTSVLSTLLEMITVDVVLNETYVSDSSLNKCCSYMWHNVSYTMKIDGVPLLSYTEMR